MIKGINLYSSTMPYKEFLPMLNKAGFDGVLISYPDPKVYDVEDLKAEIKNNGLKIIMIHCRYDESVLDHFWQEDKIGDEVESKYINQIKNCQSFAPVDMIFHFNAKKGVRYTEIGKRRIKNILDVANKLGIRVCTENLYSYTMQARLLKDFEKDNLVMCYDCGHENFLTPYANYLTKFRRLIVQTHLHNNDGVKDLHNPINCGNIDYSKIAKKLALCKEDLPLCLEIKGLGENPSQEFLNEQKRSLDVLEDLIYNNKKRG